MNMKNFNSGNNVFTQETYLQTQVTILRSRSLLKRVGQHLLSTGVIAPGDLPREMIPSIATTGQKAAGPEFGANWGDPMRDTRLWI